MDARTLDADEIIRLLALKPHPEGGHFVETWRHRPDGGGRGAGTAIYFLLAEGERSLWHRVDATEIWHYYAGAPLLLSVSLGAGHLETLTLGPELFAGQRPQGVVPEGAWQSACSTGSFTLVGCTVSPAFVLSGFEMGPPGFDPSRYA